MIPVLKPLLFNIREKEPYIRSLAQLYAVMDAAYQDAAGRYGFVCAGCKNNCCRTRFYHFSLMEYLYLYEGYRLLNASLRRVVQKRSWAYNRRMEAAEADATPMNAFCPLNAEGACLLYPWRPMICRLHGIPHELHTPGRPIFHGTGCAAFIETCGGKPYVPFDRTPFYQQLAGQEGALRKAIGAGFGIRMTVAGMLLDFETPFPKPAAPLSDSQKDDG